MLALRKLGFSGQEISAMSESEAGAWLEAYDEVISKDEGGPTKYVVKRDARKGPSSKGRR